MGIERTLLDTRIRHLNLDPAVCVQVTAGVGEALEAMRLVHSGCVLVTEGGRLAGIFTERDFVTKVAGQDVDAERPVREFMTPDPAALSRDASLAEAIRLMDRGGYRNIPLVGEEGVLQGCLSVNQLIDFLAEHYPQEVLALPPRPDQMLSEPDGA
ncbi:MAG: CBS domain-containing protein [Acidobacteriota bacterium]